MSDDSYREIIKPRRYGKTTDLHNTVAANHGKRIAYVGCSPAAVEAFDAILALKTHDLSAVDPSQLDLILVDDIDEIPNGQTIASTVWAERCSVLATRTLLEA